MTLDFQPFISIIVPVYNGSNYLRYAIESALSQSYKNFEVIVINDGSKDDGKTKEIALKFGNKIKYYEKENGGISSAFNFGIKKMEGDYYSWLSHDDIYYPYKLETQVKYLNKYKNRNVILYSDYDIIFENSLRVEKFRLKYKESKNIRLSLITGYPVNGNTVLIPKFCFSIVGLFNENLKTAQDYDMWWRLSGKFEFIHIPVALIQSRKHSQQGTILDTRFRFEFNNYYKKIINEIKENKIINFPLKTTKIRLFSKLLINFSIRKGEKNGFPVDYLREIYINEPCKFYERFEKINVLFICKIINCISILEFNIKKILKSINFD
jgi:hypothetical protein